MRRGRGAGATPRSLLPDHVGAPRLVALSLAAIDDGEEAKPIIDRFGNPMMLPRGAAKTKTRRPSSLAGRALTVTPSRFYEMREMPG